MKKYIVPMIKIQQLTEMSDLMAASPNYGGDAGISGGTGPKPGNGTAGQAKHFDMWGDNEE